MNINTAPGAVSRNAAHVTPGYMSGFGNSFETEALPGALPIGRNSPARPLRRVDFPAPLGPTTATSAPAGISADR